MKFNIATVRTSGLEAKWGRTRHGAPAIFARKPGTQTWWMITKSMWADAQSEGLASAFERHTMLGDIFSIPA
jgi:hypothetical protein